MQKTTKILLIVTSVLALGGIAYYIYIEQQKKKITKILENSVENIVNQYDVFN